VTEAPVEEATAEEIAEVAEQEVEGVEVAPATGDDAEAEVVAEPEAAAEPEPEPEAEPEAAEEEEEK